MPETAVNKHHCPETGKDEIWTAGQIGAVKSEAKAESVRGPTNSKFRFCIS